jgi:hypothetical protein
VKALAVLFPLFFLLCVGWKDMQVSPAPGAGGTAAYELEVSLATAGNSEWVIVPRGTDTVTITVVCTGGATAKIQTSTDTVYTVKSGTPTPVDWGAGATTGPLTEYTIRVTAWRLVQIGAGTAKAKATAQ